MITIVWGTKLFGGVDRVPGLFHIATEFHHLWYMPLIPSRSVIVTSENGNAWEGVVIRMNLKSVALAWSRTILLMCWALIGTVVLLAVFVDNHPATKDMVLSIVWTGGTFLLWLALLMLPLRIRPSRQRAEELGRKVNLTPTGWEILNAVYADKEPSHAS